MRADQEFGTIPRMALMAAARFGGHPAVVDGRVRLSFEEVSQGMTLVGRALMASGVRPADRVALWAPNSAVWTIAALGIQACGAWLVPINTRLTAGEAGYIVERSDARAVLAPESFLGRDYGEMLRKAVPGIEADRSLVTLPGPGEMGSAKWDAFLGRATAVSEAELTDRLERIGPNDVCDIIFTSGTTGRPKGVMLRHGSSLRAFEVFNTGIRLRPGARHAIAVPFFHCFGYKAGWMLNLMTGATSYPLAVFDAEAMMELIHEEGITHLGGPPTIFTSMLDHPRRSNYDLTSLESVIVSAAAVDPELILCLRQDVGIKGAVSGYGLTESHGLVSVADPDDPAELISSSWRTISAAEHPPKTPPPRAAQLMSDMVVRGAASVRSLSAVGHNASPAPCSR
jgi:acyl-CoA synthetase (AMP-forming)/AMP-acid ligase II